MADEVTQTTAKAGSFLTKKVGPLPLGIWLVAGVGIYYYYSRMSASGSASTAATTSAAGSQTDPAGNVGTIDPSTGYVYGSPEDTAALQQASGSDTTGSGSSTSGSTGNTYSDNNAWGRAAINLLVGFGVDPTTANQAIQLYLSSQPLTSAQQADVNEAIQSLGPPPDLPGPTSTNPTPVTTTTTTTPPPSGGTTTPPPVTTTTTPPPVTTTTTPPPSGGTTKTVPPPSGGTTKTVPVPTNFVVSNKTNHSVNVTWKRVTGATSYHLAIAPMGSSSRTDQNVSASAATAVFSGLKGGTSYVIDLWALPGPANGPHAEVSVALPK